MPKGARIVDERNTVQETENFVVAIGGVAYTVGRALVAEFGIAREFDDFHAIAQGAGNRIQTIGRADEQHPAEVEWRIEVVVSEGRILLRVQNFQ